MVQDPLQSQQEMAQAQHCSTDCLLQHSKPAATGAPVHNGDEAFPSTAALEQHKPKAEPRIACCNISKREEKKGYRFGHCFDVKSSLVPVHSQGIKLLLQVHLGMMGLKVFQAQQRLEQMDKDQKQRAEAQASFAQSQSQSHSPTTSGIPATHPFSHQQPGKRNCLDL